MEVGSIFNCFQILPLFTTYCCSRATTNLPLSKATGRNRNSSLHRVGLNGLKSILSFLMGLYFLLVHLSLKRICTLFLPQVYLLHLFYFSDSYLAVSQHCKIKSCHLFQDLLLLFLPEFSIFSFLVTLCCAFFCFYFQSFLCQLCLLPVTHCSVAQLSEQNEKATF